MGFEGCLKGGECGAVSDAFGQVSPPGRGEIGGWHQLIGGHKLACGGGGARRVKWGA